MSVRNLNEIRRRDMCFTQKRFLSLPQYPISHVFFPMSFHSPIAVSCWGMNSELRVLHVGEVGGPRVKLGPYDIETLIAESDEGAATAYRIRIAPHQRTQVSYHLVAEEFYYVISGSGVALLDGIERSLRAGDFLRLPPGTTHGFVTEEEELVMLDVHAPGSRPNRDVYFLEAGPEGFGVPRPS
jgi:mannose-6-phosphate isomerase-like protein (cupin superfamily)